jgi:hypothetical protein
MLAESENVSVLRCSCGTIQLQIGPVCLTMLPHELTEVGVVLQRALDGAGRGGARPKSALNSCFRR